MFGIYGEESGDERARGGPEEHDLKDVCSWGEQEENAGGEREKANPGKCGEHGGEGMVGHEGAIDSKPAEAEDRDPKGGSHGERDGGEFPF